MPAIAALERLEGLGAVERQLQNLDIPANLLSAPETLIPMREYGLFYENTARFLGIKDLGTYAASNFDVGNFGAMGQYVIQGPTLRDALNRVTVALNYHASSDLYTLFEACDRDGNAVVNFQSAATQMAGWPHVANLAVVLTVDIIKHYSRDRSIQPTAAVNYDYKFKSSALETLLSSEVEHGANSVRVSFPVHLLDLANPDQIAPGNIMTFGDFKRSLTAPASKDAASSVMQVMRLELRSGYSSVERLGSRLGLGVRSLQRYLENEGTNFRNLLEEVRSERACELMRGTDLSTKDISSQLLYSTPSHFIRAFRKQHGMTPGRFKQYFCANR